MIVFQEMYTDGLIQKASDPLNTNIQKDIQKQTGLVTSQPKSMEKSMGVTTSRQMTTVRNPVKNTLL